jgi:hypothetical protein
VTLEGFNATMPLGPVTLDNVVIDNMGKLDSAAEFADIRLGPGDVSFTPRGLGVTVTDTRVTDPLDPLRSKPRECVFPTLPTPEVPPGWLR